MPIYSRYSGVSGPSLNFVGVAPISVNKVLNTVTTSMTQSSATTDGWLSAADWINFDSKQPAGSYANTSLSNLIAPTAINVALLGTLGTVTAPSYSFTGDTNTGIYSSGADTLGLVTNGLDRITITSTGNVGINSTTPNARLQVNQSGTQLGLSVYSTSTNNTAELYNQGTTNYTLALNSAANSAQTGASIGGYFARGTLSSRLQTLSQDSLLSISASGYTGSGVAGISAAVVLATDENTTSTAYGGQIVFATTPNSTPGGFPLPRVYIKNDGNVGIGTASPSSKLSVQGELRLFGSTSGYVGVKSTAAPTSYTVTLPSAQGAASTVLLNDGAGNLSWTTVSGAGGANTFLSNLTAPTAINQSLLFNPDNTYDIGADGASRPAGIHAASHVTAPVVRGRDNVGGAGQHDITVRGGDGLTGNKDGGILTLRGGNAIGAANNGGDVTISGGLLAGTGTNGVVNIEGGGVNIFTAARSTVSTSGPTFSFGTSSGGTNVWQKFNIGNAAVFQVVSSGFGTKTFFTYNTDQLLQTETNFCSVRDSLQSFSTMPVFGLFNSQSSPGTPILARFYAGFLRNKLGVGSQLSANAMDGGTLSVGGVAEINITAAPIAGITATGTNVITYTRETTGLNQRLMTYGIGVGDDLRLVQTGQPDLIVTITAVATSGNNRNYTVNQTVSALYNGATAYLRQPVALMHDQAGVVRLKIDYDGNTTVTGNTTLSGAINVKSIHNQAGVGNIITVSTSDFYVGVDTSTNPKTVNLPSAATVGAGRQIVVKDESGNCFTNNIVITPSGVETIDGSPSFTLKVNYESASIISDGTNWFVY